MNNDAREDELNSTHQGLSNNTTGHDFVRVSVTLLFKIHFKSWVWESLTKMDGLYYES